MTTIVAPPWEEQPTGGEIAARAKTEADRATTQADRAKTEADRASAITGLNTVADAVGMAALPLPDVWVPLSDSLRMITGYGREVKVGEDVVARMVNFSRSTTATYIGKDGLLKTAAANEPRFEKEGLLIEGQSTNLRSQPLHLGNVVGATGESLSDTLGAINAAKYTITADVGLRLTFMCPPALSTSLTFSIKIHQSSSVRSGILLVRDHTAGVNLDTVNFNLDTDSDSATCKKLGQWNCYTVTTTRFTSGSVPWVYFGAAGANLTGQTVGKFLVIGDCQVEPLPFASSYIPTNGAAVTRAADVCWIPVENGGLPGMNNEKTMSLTSDILGVSGPYNFILSTPWGAIDYTPTQERVSGSAAALNMNTPVALKTSVRKVARFTKGGGLAAIFGDIQKTSPIKDWSLNTSRIMIGSMSESGANPHFGHVKDLKIWLKPLSDAQMKAIA